MVVVQKLHTSQKYVFILKARYESAKLLFDFVRFYVRFIYYLVIRLG